ncbi:hypothetical protein ES332_D09G115200v1 [Gossypium tomentosum]|uniref:Uncharacterized protein n=1 Tax=Gossypium tomentosum TaxID=34277 RepID=A0A5D2JFN8_GOSTO|nr:hypothetical protein ES332_D09G115200v1 [Gossypium tomentosum]
MAIVLDAAFGKPPRARQPSRPKEPPVTAIEVAMESTVGRRPRLCHFGARAAEEQTLGCRRLREERLLTWQGAA